MLIQTPNHPGRGYPSTLGTSVRSLNFRMLGKGSSVWNTMASSLTNRSRLACAPCTRRKVKCSKTVPCTNCLRR
ncbi:hypothetical protein LZ31DRAFT_65325 [Colletotrichum somersetense]|nr:hypothetical protein LZ31DRAFT_65325 [Colletotrichum somersetense]